MEQLLDVQEQTVIDQYDKLQTEITERRRAEEKQKELYQQLLHFEKLAAVGQLGAGVAHELNNPLTGLLGLMRSRQKKVAEGSLEGKDNALMLRACEHMAKIIKDLSDFARPSRGEWEDMTLEDVINTTLTFSISEFKIRGTKITTDYQDNPSKVKGDKVQLQQVVLNILTNARDAMPEQGELIVRTERLEGDKKVMMAFSDNGTGIQEADLPKIFDPFFTTKRPGKGTGLGLSVTYSIVKQHGGEIRVESVVGKGSTFSVLLPTV